MGGEDASPTNPEKRRTGRLKTKDADRMKDVLILNHKCVILWIWINLLLGL